jgi:DNA-binding transcriptional LysR family regulator
MISDWSDLQTILAIATQGTLSGAARQLGLNQSTVSRRLQSIELAMNRQLFVRSGDGKLAATPTGLALAEVAGRIKTAVQEANAVVGGTSAPIRIATCEILSTEFAAPMLTAWFEQSGQLGDIAVYDNLFIVPDSEFEVMITPLDSAPSEMVGRRIGSISWRLYANNSYLVENPVSAPLENLEGHRVIQASGPLEDVAAFGWFAALGGNPVFSSSSVFSQRDFALAGKAIALLPDNIAGRSHELVALPVLGDTPVSEVWMIARKAVASQPRVRSFLDWSKSFKHPHNASGLPVKLSA